MSEDNKALVRRWLEEVLTRGNLERAEVLFARNYVLHDPSFPRDVYGPEGVKRYVAAYRFAFPDARFAVEDQIAEGDKVVSRWTARGTHRGEFLDPSHRGGSYGNGYRVRPRGRRQDRGVVARLPPVCGAGARSRVAQAWDCGFARSLPRHAHSRGRQYPGRRYGRFPLADEWDS